MEHLSLHGVEERFNEGVVGDLAWAVHALREAQLGKALLEGTSGILGAPIGVEYEAATGLTAVHGAIERFEGELHILPGAIAPTDNAPAVLVHDHRQEAVDRADLEVSDIADPHLVGALELKIELLVGNCTEEALNARARVAQSSHARFDPVRSHEAGDTMLSNPMAAAAQCLVNPRTAIDATALGVNRPDLACQRFVLALTLATLARAPSIKASPRYPVYPAHQREIMLCPVYFDEGEDLRFRSEANRMAFFRSSCSSLSTL